MGSPAETQFNSNNNATYQDEETFSYAMDLVNSGVISMSMYVAIQLGLFEILAKAGPDAKLSPKQISAQLPTNNPEAPSMLDRLLRLLTSYRIVGCTVPDGEGNTQRLYSLTSVSKLFVPCEDGVCLAPLLSMYQDKVLMDTWFHMKDAILEGGIAFNRVHGVGPFEYPAKNPRFNQVLNDSMMNHSIIFVKKMLDTYKGFEQLNRVVDVGGGLGVTLSLITSKYPSIKGINFDLPHVIRDAPSYPAIEHVGGDMFENVPKGDAIFMKWMLHNWDDKDCIKLLRNCYNAIPDDGKIIVVDAAIPFAPETSASMRCNYILDVSMITVNPGAKERSKQEFEDLAIKAGFSGVRYACPVFNLWVMEFFK